MRQRPREAPRDPENLWARFYIMAIAQQALWPWRRLRPWLFAPEGGDAREFVWGKCMEICMGKCMGEMYGDLYGGICMGEMYCMGKCMGEFCMRKCVASIQNVAESGGGQNPHLAPF